MPRREVYVVAGFCNIYVFPTSLTSVFLGADFLGHVIFVFFCTDV